MKKYIFLCSLAFCLSVSAFAEVKQAQVKKRTETNNSEHTNYAIKSGPSDSSGNSTSSSGNATDSSSNSTATALPSNTARDIIFDGYTSIWYDTDCVDWAKTVKQIIGVYTYKFDDEELELVCEVPAPAGHSGYVLTWSSGPANCAQELMNSTYVYHGVTYYFVDPTQADVKTTTYPLSLYDVAYVCAGADDSGPSSYYQAACIYDRMITFDYSVNAAFDYCKRNAYSSVYVSSAASSTPSATAAVLTGAAAAVGLMFGMHNF